MFTLKPHQIFLTFLTIFLLLSPFTCSDPTEDEEIDELIALDEAEDELSQGNAKPSEAEALSRAQRIVVELNNDNTKKLLDENEFVLVLGYAPWCPRSAELMPRFAEAATALKEIGNPVVLAKIDAERFSIAASALEIKGFPTLLLFVNATPSPYTGGFTSEEIVIWTRKKTGMPVIRVNSVSEAEEFHKKHHMYAVGLFEKFEVYN
jgi:protein disulfide-isomerase A1